MELPELIEQSKRFGVWAHLATVSPSGTPYVSPVHPCWEGNTLWTMLGSESVKAKNVAAGSSVACHWQVGPDTGFDSFMMWADGEVHDDVETKKRLWTDVFDYDLNEFAPGGPEDSPGTAFLAMRPNKVVWLKTYGMQGREEWRA